MPRVPVHTTADAPGQSQEALRGLERRMGRVLNIHAEMAHAPVVLAAYQGIQRAITKHGSFDAKTREAIALAVAAAGKCAYCQSAHTAGGEAAGWSLEETVAIPDGTAELDPKLAALLAVAREIAGSTGYVTDVTWQAALQAGWGDTELADCSPTWRRTRSPTTSTTTGRPSLTCAPRLGGGLVAARLTARGPGQTQLVSFLTAFITALPPIPGPDDGQPQFSRS